MFDPDAFGAAMGELIRERVEPLQKKIEQLERQLAERPDVEALVRAAVAAIPAPVNGKDADMDAVRAFIAEQVQALPAPKDGESVTLEDVAPLIASEVEKAVAAMPKPKDGENGKSVTVDDVAGVLEVAVSKWALEFERRAQDVLQKAIDKMPVPKNGKDGRDGVGFDDLEVEYDGIKTVTFKMRRGEVVKEFDLTLPVVVDCGIFKEGQTYQPGDGVTWGGSYWIAQKETSAKPDSPDSGFRLAVKRGRDGKDGRDGIDKTAPVKVKD